MMNAATQASIRVASNAALISSRIACTGNVRVEFLRCRTEASVQWRVPGPELALMWSRDRQSDVRVIMEGRPTESTRAGDANIWFFPQGVHAQGELTSKADTDCVGVFVDPSFVPQAARAALAEPIFGFTHGALGRAFNELAGQLVEPDDLLPLYTEGWAMQALAHVARAGRKARPRRAASPCGLAPWQLRRAREMLLADLSDNLPLREVARACKLSVSHFVRGFKLATGAPPHQWLIAARLERARELLAKSATPLAELAGICGFADQSHFSRMFARVHGTSPNAWRREHGA